MPMKREYRAIAAAAAALLVLAGSRPAAAQEGVIASIANAAATVWTYVSAPFSAETVTFIAPKPMLYVSSVHGVSNFWDNLRDAGYELKEVDTGVGIIPDIRMKFQLARELSDADREWLEHKLEIDERKRSGLTAMMQRQIVRTLLAASSLEDMQVSQLEIALLPLPSAEFIMSPKEGKMDPDHDVLLRALQAHIREMRGPKAQAPAKPQASN
jgi:hypothetical protein